MSLNVSYDLVNQVIQRPRALVQRSVTGARAREEGRYERQVGLPPGRRQGHGGPLKTKLHPPQHTTSSCLSLSVVLSIYNNLMLHTVLALTPLFSRLAPFFAFTVIPEILYEVTFLASRYIRLHLEWGWGA